MRVQPEKSSMDNYSMGSSALVVTIAHPASFTHKKFFSGAIFEAAANNLSVYYLDLSSLVNFRIGKTIKLS
jgi:hypothetical protein